MKLLQVKSFKETLGESMCGPASLKTVLDYYGVEKSETELATLCSTTKELGTSEEGIRKAAINLGFKVETKQNSTFEDIQGWLDKEVPVIVDWFTRGRIDYDESEVADGHYSVVVGLDNEYIYIEDPELGKMRKIKKEDFMIVWFDFKGKLINPNELVIREIIAIYK